VLYGWNFSKYAGFRELEILLSINLKPMLGSLHYRQIVAFDNGKVKDCLRSLILPGWRR